jgi:hypothetical protein
MHHHEEGFPVGKWKTKPLQPTINLPDALLFLAEAAIRNKNTDSDSRVLAKAALEGRNDLTAESARLSRTN